MTMSFHQWRADQRQRFDADLRRLKRGAGRATRLTRRRARWWSIRWWHRPKLLIFGLACLGLAAAAWSPSPIMIAGSTPAVIDGDTFRMGGNSIRLQGIDAPESEQTCTDGWPAGDAARRALAALLAGGVPQCERVTTDSYGRTVAICRVNGEDIGAVLVRRGLAWAYTSYSWRYWIEEWQAWYEGAGVHSRDCARPSAWRADHPKR
jgi:endonuclease YncB( thermonuclease family)